MLDWAAVRRLGSLPWWVRSPARTAYFAAPLLFAAASGAELALVGLEYSAPSGCPDREAFVRKLEARTERVRTAEEGSQGLLRVEIAGTAAAARGAITFREPDGRVTERSIDGASCADLVDALALVAVVLVDPDAQLGADGAAGASSADEQGSSAKPSAPQSSDAAEAPDAGSDATARTSPAPTDTPPEPLRRSNESWRLGVGVGAGLHAGTAPNPPIGFFIDLNAERRRRNAFGPALGLSIQRAESEPVRTAGGDAEFTWFAARAWVCPLHWPSAGLASVAACGAFEGGNLSGRGFNTVDEQIQDSLWLAPGLFARGELRPVEALTITLDAGAVVPLFHTDFFFDPEISAFQVPYVAPFASLGVRLQAD